MAKDFMQKEPSKNEKMIYELYMQMQGMERAMWTTSAHVCALAISLGADPAKVAEIMANQEEQIKAYSGKINEVIAQIDHEKHEKEKGHTHEHGEEHQHNEEAKEEAPAEKAE